MSLFVAFLDDDGSIKYKCEHGLTWDEIPDGDTTPVSKFQAKPFAVIEDIHGKCLVQEVDILGRPLHVQHDKPFRYVEAQKPQQAVKLGPIANFIINIIGSVEESGTSFLDWLIGKEKIEA